MGRLRSNQFTDLQLAFISEYARDRNGARAVTTAGYRQTNPSNYANYLLKIPKIASAVAARIEKQEQRALREADDVIAAWCDVAFADLTDVIQWNADAHEVHLTASGALTPQTRAALKKITITRKWVGGNQERPPDLIERVEVEMHDKLRALESLGKHFGVGDDQSTVFVLIREIERRADAAGLPFESVLERFTAMVPERIARQLRRMEP